jgi:hypothetical protein
VTRRDYIAPLCHNLTYSLLPPATLPPSNISWLLTALFGNFLRQLAYALASTFLKELAIWTFTTKSSFYKVGKWDGNCTDVTYNYTDKAGIVLPLYADAAYCLTGWQLNIDIGSDFQCSLGCFSFVLLEGGGGGEPGHSGNGTPSWYRQQIFLYHYEFLKRPSSSQNYENYRQETI